MKNNDSKFIRYLFPSILAFATAPFLARGLGPDLRGVYSSVTNLYLMLAIVFGRGIDTAITTSYRKNIEFNVIRRIIHRYFKLLVITSSVTTFLITRIYYGHRFSLIWGIVLSVAVPQLIIFNFVAGWARNNRKLSTLASMQSIPAILRSLAIFILYEIKSLNVGSAVFFTLFANLPFLFFIQKKYSKNEPVSNEIVTKIASQGLRAYPNSLLTISTYRLDQILGLYIIGARQLGIYAVSVTIAEIPLILSRSYRDGLFAPEFKKVKSLIRKALSRAIFLIILLSLLLPFAFVKIFGIRYKGGVEVSEVMLLTVLIQILFELTNVYPLRRQEYNVVAISQFIYLCVTFIAVFIFRYNGAMAMAWANFAGYFAALVFILIKEMPHLKKRQNYVK